MVTSLLSTGITHTTYNTETLSSGRMAVELTFRKATSTKKDDKNDEQNEQHSATDAHDNDDRRQRRTITRL